MLFYLQVRVSDENVWCLKETTQKEWPNLQCGGLETPSLTECQICNSSTEYTEEIIVKNQKPYHPTL